MMTVKLEQIVEADRAIVELMMLRGLPGRVQFRVACFIETMRTILKQWADVRTAKMNELGTIPLLDKDGKELPGQFEVAPEKKEEFLKFQHDALDEDIQLDLKEVVLPEKNDLTLQSLSYLLKFGVTVDEIPAPVAPAAPPESPKILPFNRPVK